MAIGKVEDVDMNLEANDNSLAEIIDPEAAASMEAAGYDLRFIEVMEPAFFNRLSGQWSAQTYHGGQPCSMILGTEFEEVAERYRRHKEGDTSLCSENGKLVAEQMRQIRADAKAYAARVRAWAEGAAWDELNALAMAGDKEAEAEVIERAVYESGKETPIYEELLAKYWVSAAAEAKKI